MKSTMHSVAKCNQTLSINIILKTLRLGNKFILYNNNNNYQFVINTFITIASYVCSIKPQEYICNYKLACMTV